MIKSISAVMIALAVVLMPAVASAHVTVKPGTVKVGEFTTFNVSVPNEKDNPVTNVKLLIPEGIKSVKPTVKTGWTVTVEKSGSGDGEKATAIVWNGGSIDAGLRDDFSFSTQAPAKTTELNWKAYETYSDGTVSSWDQAPDAKEAEGKGPYSTTEVVDDLKTTPAASSEAAAQPSNSLPIALSLLAIALSIGSLLFKKRA